MLLGFVGEDLRIEGSSRERVPHLVCLAHKSRFATDARIDIQLLLAPLL